MSVAEQGAPAPTLPRTVPLIVRLQPTFVNRLCGRIQKPGAGQMQNTGLLFGIAGERLVIVQAFKSFSPSDPDRSELLDDAQLEQNLKQLMEAAQNDPEVSVLNSIGWYSLRATEGLQANDVKFHDAQFPQRNDLALILKREGENNLLVEFYTRGPDGVLSAKEHSWGALRLLMDVPAAGPIEIAMRPELAGEQLNAREGSTRVASADALDRALAREERKTQATRRTPLSILATARKRRERSNSAGTEAARARAAIPAPTASADRAVVRTRSIVLRNAPTGPNPLVRIRAGQVPSVPAVWAAAPRQPRLSWVWPAVLCVLAASVTFAALLLRGFASGSAPAFLRTVLPDSGLNLRVEGQGERLLLSWNRNSPVVRSANEGVLHIDDGPQHRDVRLDFSQVENGLVLYRPASGDVTFRLEVRGQQGASSSESIRVLDGAKGTPLELGGQPQPSSDAPDYPGHNVSTMAAVPKEANKAHTPEAGRRQTAEPHPENSVSAQKATDKSNTAAAVAAKSSPALAPPVLVSSNPSTIQPNATSALPPIDQPTPVVPPAAGPASSMNRDFQNTGPEANSSPSALADADFPQMNPPRAASVPKPPETQSTPAPSRADPTAPPVNNQLPAVTAPKSQLPTDFVPARALLQVLPDTHSISRAVLQAYRQVEVTVHVDASGHVETAHVITQNKRVADSLAGAAIMAAKRWTFQPATLHGRAIESDHTIVFQFRRSE